MTTGITDTTAAASATSATDGNETMNHVIMVLGDTSIEAFTSSGILEANENICAVLVSTERATVEDLDRPGGFRSRLPERVFTVYLKPAPTGFELDFPELLPWLTPRPDSQRHRGGAEGALDRADAATRLMLSNEFRDGLRDALIWAHNRPIDGIHLAVGVVGFVVAGRMTGSGTLVAAVDVLEELLVDFDGAADKVWIDLLIGTASITQHAPTEFEDARIGTTALIAELGVAIADPAAAGPSGQFGRHLGHIMLLGPPEGGGTLRDVRESNASLQLALSAVVSGLSQRQREALRPSANRTVNSGDSNAVFAGIGVLEVVFDPARAARSVARRILATMPKPPVRA
jgi:hypothetical protein